MKKIRLTVIQLVLYNATSNHEYNRVLPHHVSYSMIKKNLTIIRGMNSNK